VREQHAADLESGLGEAPLPDKAVHEAAHQARLPKYVTTHAFRHSFAAHILEDGYDIRTVQELLDHKDVRTTMIYAYVLNRGGRGVQRPLDRLREAVLSESNGLPAPERADKTESEIA